MVYALVVHFVLWAEDIKYALGIRFDRLEDGGYFLSQTAYIDSIVKAFGLEHAKSEETPLPTKCKPTIDDAPKTDADKEEMKGTPYQSAIGKLLYLAMGTRPDIAYHVSALSRFVNNPGKTHWKQVKHVIRYIKGTRNYGLLYRKNQQPPVLHAMSEASHKSADNAKSWVAHAVLLNNMCWTWRSTITKCVPTSPPHAEMIAAHNCLQDVRWASHLLDHLQVPYPKPIFS